MDFSLREWLIILGGLVIIAVLVDGYRRVRKNKQGQLKLSIDKNLKFRGGDDSGAFNTELPNGGARIISASAASKSQGQELPSDAEPQGDEDSNFQEQDGFSDDREELKPDPLFVDSVPGASVATNVEQEDPTPTTTNDPEQAANSDSAEVQEPAPVEEVVVINVFAIDEAAGFRGSDLLRVVLACGMRFGDMDIFHRSENEDDSGVVQFSMASVVKPGVFDLDQIDGFSTPGVSFFLSMPGPKNPMKAFDYMLETAQVLVKNLEGELRDSQHSSMTVQTIEHSRQKIRDFERRQLSLLQ